MSNDQHILMSADNPNGAKLEELLVVLQQEVMAKTVKIMGDPRKEAKAVVQNNLKIIELLKEAEVAQRTSMNILGMVGPNQGPGGKPRIGLTEDDLVYAAGARCECGAGLAYIPWDKLQAMGLDHRDPEHNCWDCSDILLGRAIPAEQPDAKKHSGKYPFAFYEIKSENQPSANGTTTRPK